jgi:small-conductance mechanosensitive channel
MEQFDRGSYTLAAGAIGIMSTNHWLPSILKTRYGVADTSQQLVITRLATCVMFFTTIFAAALIFGVPAKNLLGFGGIGGLTFGLAAKDLISNFIGGSMLAIMRPFSPGEKIYLMSVNGRFRGTNEPSVGGYDVKEIGWYQTTLVPKDTRPTTVPNGFFLGANVINITRQEYRLIVAAIRVRYEDAANVPIMTEEITAYLRGHPDVVKGKRPIRVHLREVKSDHLAIRVEAHVSIKKKDPFLVMQQEVLLEMFDIVKRHSTGPAWPVVNNLVSAIDVGSWQEDGDDAPTLPAPAL